MELIQNPHVVKQIEKPRVEIVDYEITFKPFLFQWMLNGRLEINSEFKIPLQSLFAKFIFPNQAIYEAELIPNEKEVCKNSEFSCQVLETKAFVKLSGDKYFAREIKDYETIPFQISFELNTKNQSYFLNVNRISDPYHPKYINFINEIKFLKIENSFSYKNTFFIHRKEYESRYKELKVPSQWIIYKNKKPFYTYEIFNFFLQNYDHINKPIREWFSLKNKNKKISLDFSDSHILLSNGQKLQGTNLKKRIVNDWINFDSSFGLKKTKENQYIQDFWVNEIFIPEKIKGTLNNKVILTSGPQSYLIYISNDFSFNHDYVIGRDKEIKVIIYRKEDYYFKDLDSFKWIDL